MEPCKTIREKASELLSAIRRSKQREALVKGAETLKCIDELQEITTEEVGAPSVSVKTARESLLNTAVNLAAESAGRNLSEARKILSDCGYPPELGEGEEKVEELIDPDE